MPILLIASLVLTPFSTPVVGTPHICGGGDIQEISDIQDIPVVEPLVAPEPNPGPEPIFELIDPWLPEDEPESTEEL